jgi:ATP/maltotriose-dependent transcriptional regulator MalT
MRATQLGGTALRQRIARAVVQHQHEVVEADFVRPGAHDGLRSSRKYELPNEGADRVLPDGAWRTVGVLALELSENYVSHSTAIEAGLSLSARELMIVLLMGHGLTNKMIARQLSIGPETVKSHAKNIFWKLMVQTRAQAVYRASELGLI